MRSLHILAVAAVLSSGSAWAQDNCKDVLINGYFESFTRLNASQKNAYTKTFYCSHNFNEGKQFYQESENRSQGGELSVGYGPFSLGGSASSGSGESITQEEYEQWQSENCGNSAADEAEQTFDYVAQSTVANSVISAWQSCITNREGLTCWASPFSEDAYIRIAWRKESLSQPVVLSSFLNDNAQSQFDKAPRNKWFPVNTLLNPGMLELPIKRLNDKEVTGSLTVQHDGVNYACRVYIPSQEEIAVRELSVNELFANIQPKDLVREEIGCTVKALGKPCLITKVVTASAGHKLCEASYDYKEGPTEGAEFQMEVADRAVNLTVQVVPSLVLFGPGRWVKAAVVVTEVPIDMPPELMKAKGCNVGS